MSFSKDNQPNSGKFPRLKILVVDDDASNRNLMQILLMREGYQVDVASDGLEAFEAIKHQKFDIVFMDLHMPVMDGIEASHCIREWESGGQGQHTFIVALTASYMPDEGQKLFDVGIDNYISKPFELDHIHRMLKYRADARFSSEELPPEETFGM